MRRNGALLRTSLPWYPDAMNKAAPLLLMLALFFPVAAEASTILTQRTLVVSEPIHDNAYLGGADVNVTVPLPGDVLAGGGTLTLSAPVAGDALLTGARIDIAKAVAGDVRAVGASILIEDRIGGDLVAAGGTVIVRGNASSTRIVGGQVTLENGARGPVVIYGADVSLGGEYAGDVEVTASDSLVIAENTIIRGVLKYNAPQEVAIPASASVMQGVVYTGSSSYLPTSEEAQRFAIAGAGVLLVVRIIAAVIAAGLIAGLFPVFNAQVIDRTLARSPRRFILLTLLGFAVAVATPVLIILLIVSFVGMGVAVILGLLYVLLLILGYLYAGILAGAALSRGLLKRPGTSWRAAVLGTAALYLIGSIPALGPAITLVLATAAMGSILTIAYRFAFAREADEITVS